MLGDDMQINRLFEIIYLLLEKKSITAKDLAENFQVSTRTIYRDIDVLSSAGIPVYMSKGKGGGISLLPNFVLNKTVLTEKEKGNILASLKAVNLVSLDDRDSALEKLSSLFGDNEYNWMEIDFSSWSNPKEEKRIFNNIKTAILGKRVVTFNYSSGKGEKTEREIEPLKLCYKGDSWYLYGYCYLREEYRFFKLRRIKNLNILEKEFSRKAPIEIFHQENSYEKEYYKLVLKISKTMEYRIFDEFDNYKKLPDGNYIVETLFPKGPWIFSYIFSYVDECEVLEPVELRQEVKKKINNMIKKYL